MCSTCDTARRQPLKKAFATIAAEMRRLPRGGRGTCLDKTIGELLGMGSTGQDALDHETTGLKESP